ncbi:hypothetical protein ACVMAJ_003552 [Bradyrhizobium sp. USDA 4448]
MDPEKRWQSATNDEIHLERHNATWAGWSIVRQPGSQVKERRAGAGRCDRAWTQAGSGTRYEAKKTGRSASAVKKAVKKVGNSRKRVEKRLGR